jgi:hypothetical protein
VDSKSIFRNGVLGLEITVFVLTAFVSSAGAEQVLERRPADVESITKDSVGVAWDFVDMPLGKVLLVRAGTQRCAVRFLSSGVVKPADSALAFYRGREKVEATMEVFDAKEGRVRQQRLDKWTDFQWGKVVPYGPSHDSLRCGRLKLFWFLPTALSFGDQKGVEFAPTNVDSVAAINFDDPRWRWFGIDMQRGYLVLPVDSLELDKSSQGH